MVVGLLQVELTIPSADSCARSRPLGSPCGPPTALRLRRRHTLGASRSVGATLGSVDPIDSAKDRIRKNFNVSIAEVEDNDQWQSAVLAVALVSNDKRMANRVLSKVVDFIESSRDLVVDDYQLGFC